MAEEEKMSWGMMLRFVVLILIFAGLIIGLMWKIGKLEQKLREYENAPADTVTVIRHDTIKIDSPIPVYKYIKQTEYIAVKDTLLQKDTVKELIYLPREYMVYKDSTYRAVVSGVEPRLDSIEIYRPVITNTITKTITKKTRWGIGPQVGVGYDGKKVAPYVGVGVQYNLFAF